LDVRYRFAWWRRAQTPYGDEFTTSMGAGQPGVEWGPLSSRRVFRPPFDIFETDEHIVVKVEIAGMREEDFEISLEGYVLHIGGTRGDPDGKLAYQRMEVNYGEFRLDIRLPHLVSQSEIEASYDRGFLSVYVPRRPHRRRVPIVEANEG